MNTQSVSPMRTSATPTIVNYKQRTPILGSKQKSSLSLKHQEVKAIKRELKLNKEFVQKQKEMELSLARNRVKGHKEARIMEKVKNLQKNQNSSQPVLKNNFKVHLDWVLEVEKKIKLLDEQENSLINKITKACKISLKTTRPDPKILFHN